MQKVVGSNPISRLLAPTHGQPVRLKHFLEVARACHLGVFGVGRGVSGRPAARIIALIAWAASWGAVLALDPNFVQLWDWPALMVALLVVPQLALGYFIGPWAHVSVAPLVVIWVPLAGADCAASGAECDGLGFGAAWLAFLLAVVIAAGYGLRVLRERR